jgi:two-component system, sensor histidine kinase and response regulator
LSSPQTKLLMIDDSRLVRRLVRGYVAGVVDHVIEAAEPGQGLKLAVTAAPSVILLDMNLPTMNGLDVCKLLHRRPETREIPVLFMTGEQSASMVALGLDAGAIDYIRKPFEAVEVQARVRSALRQHERFEYLRDQATRDALTGLLNRRSFDQCIIHHANFSRDTAQPATLLMIDLDHFKQINDNFGHPVGDRVLARTAAILAQTMPAGALLFRYGGEEIAALLPGCDGSAATEYGQRFLSELRRAEVSVDTGVVRWTASVGCSTLKPAPDCCPFAWLASADNALYVAKRTGRDRVVCTTSDCLRLPLDGIAPVT